MIQTIHIGHLLRETVASPYRNLVTRPTGAAIRNRIQEALADSDCLTALLDFSGIELLDLSCADEVVAKLLLADGERGWPFVVLQGLREDQHEAIEHVLTHHRLAVAAVPPGGEHAAPRLLGWVTADARAAFACVCARGALAAARAGARAGLAGGARARRRWRRSPAIAWSAPTTTGTTRSPSHEPAPPRPLDHGHPRRPPPAAGLDAGRPGPPAEQHLRRPGRQRRGHPLQPLRQQPQPGRAWPGSTRCSRAPKTRIFLASGMGATALAHLAVLRPGDHLVSSSWIYGGTQHLFDEELSRFGIDVTYVEPDQPRLWRKSVRKATRAIFVETPTNPLMRVVDLGPVAHVAREFGLALLVDATFASPINFRPLEHGADIAITSATKYLNGHSDVIAGAVAGSHVVRGGGEPADAPLGPGDRPARGLAGGPRACARSRSGWRGTTPTAPAVAAWASSACRVRQGPLSRPGRPSGSRARQEGARRLRRHGRARARRRAPRPPSGCSPGSSWSPMRRASPASRRLVCEPRLTSHKGISRRAARGARHSRRIPPAELRHRGRRRHHRRPVGGAGKG